MERVDRFETIVEGLEAGKVLPFEKLREFFNPGELHKFWDFVGNLRESSWTKFCVSWGKNPYSRDENMLFFEIGEVTSQEVPDIRFLGFGKPKGVPQVHSQFAAQTWGFAVLKMED